MNITDTLSAEQEWQPRVMQTPEDTEDSPTDSLSEEDRFFIQQHAKEPDFDMTDKTWWV